MGLLLHPTDSHPGLSEVALGVARGMGQRHEQLPCPAAALPCVVLDDGVLARWPRSRSKMRWGVWRCLRGTPRSPSRIVSMMPVKGSGLGWRGEPYRRGAGGTGQASILPTVSRCRPNTRAASRVLIPSTMQTRRTRTYSSTLYILHNLPSSCLEPCGSRRVVRFCRATLERSFPPRWYITAPPFTCQRSCHAGLSARIASVEPCGDVAAHGHDHRFALHRGAALLSMLDERRDWIMR